MPRSAYEPAARDALAARLQQLRAEQRPRWGRMDASRMLLHLLEAYRMPNGDLRIPRRPMPLRFLVRWLLLYVLPFPKGAPTARELLIRPATSFDADKAELERVIRGLQPPDTDAQVGDHPIFGRMSVRDWGVLLYKHTDHHFRQFGI